MTRIPTPVYAKPDLEWTWELPLELAAAAGWKPSQAEREAIVGPPPDNSVVEATESARQIADKNGVDLHLIPIPAERANPRLTRWDVVDWMKANPAEPLPIEEAAQDASKLAQLLVDEIHNATLLAVKRTKAGAVLVNCKLLRIQDRRPTLRLRFRCGTRSAARLLTHQDPRFHKVVNLQARD